MNGNSNITFSAEFIIYISMLILINTYMIYRGADKSLARPISWCILFDGENISFDASLVIYPYLLHGAESFFRS